MDSTTLSFTSLSIEAFVELYEKRLKPRIDTIRNSSASLQELVDAAETMVNEVFTPNPRSTFTYKNGDEEISVPLDKVVLAMLAFAEECGGESGRRYVAAAISSCSEDEDVVGALAGLGTTWLTRFLFVFKTGRTANQSSRTPSPVATPTIDLTSTYLWDFGVGPRKQSFHDDVLRRDGYRCILTGFQDSEHPEPVAGIAIINLDAAHIIRKALGEFNKDTSSDSYQSAVTTFDTLMDFTRLPVRTLEELSAKLDHPSNGMTLQFDAHCAFERFDWCLKKTEFENVYDLQILRNRCIIKKPDNNRVTFKDRSNDFSDSTGNLKRTAPIDPPNARYIEVHAAIAGILHMSGAGIFFDGLLNIYKEDIDRISAVRCWPELEELMERQILRNAVIELFRQQYLRSEE